MSESALRLVALYPELLGTYGDNGNVRVLQQRLAWRGLPVQLTRVRLGDPVPAGGDLYVLGGGEDRAQLAALPALRRSPLRAAVEAGAHVFGVCAGLQLLGTRLATAGTRPLEGLGLLDVVTERGRTRALGEVVVTVGPELGLPPLTGFENHGGWSQLSAGTRPLGIVRRGTGNGAPTGGVAYEGAYQGTVLATYLHGPVLARNPALADLLLSRVLGQPLEPLSVPAVDLLRDQRLRLAASRWRRTGAGR